MIRARFRLELPEDVWIADVSTAFPDATFRLLTGVPMGDRSLELGEVLGDDVGAAADAVETHTDVSEYDIVHDGEDRVIVRYEAVEQRLYEFLWESSLPPEFPLVVENGAMEFDVTATRDQFEAFGAALDGSGFQYELLSLVHADDPDDLLTERQRECLSVAFRKGYFEVPRDCTTAEVAASLGVDKSTVSVTLRRGTARVLNSFFVGDG